MTGDTGKQETCLAHIFKQGDWKACKPHTFTKSNTAKLKWHECTFFTSWVECTCILHSLLNQIFNHLPICTIVYAIVHFVPNLYQFGKFCEQNLQKVYNQLGKGHQKGGFHEPKKGLFLIQKICNANFL